MISRNLPQLYNALRVTFTQHTFKLDTHTYNYQYI